MWIWIPIALTLYGFGLNTTYWPTKIGLCILAAIAFNYWDTNRKCNHCKRKAHK